ncbi:MAG: galactose oxidase-like domain-containing protein, partial [Candidatus Nitrosopolaris sp.]
EQRYIELEHNQKISNTLSVKVPPNKNVIPPKYYMLFIVKEDDVPSVAPLCSCQFSLTWETELVIPRINEFKGLLFEDAYTEAINSINTKT